MAILSDPDRAALWAQMMRDASNARVPLPLLKAELLNFIIDTDTWVEANTAGYVGSLRLPARTVLTARQKMEGFRRVVGAREVLLP